MNTPAHAIINLLLFRKHKREQYPAAIIIGALLPDIPMFVFYIWSKLSGHAEQHIWRSGYFEPGWQALFDTFHSFPLLAAAWLIAWKAERPWLSIFFASMFLHSCFDFPVHHNDAHHHFFPFSDWQFHSPISYWDPAYYGQYVGALELFVVLAGGAWLLRTSTQPWIRHSVSIILLLYLAFWGFAALVWA